MMQKSFAKHFVSGAEAKDAQMFSALGVPAISLQTCQLQRRAMTSSMAGVE